LRRISGKKEGVPGDASGGRPGFRKMGKGICKKGKKSPIDGGRVSSGKEWKESWTEHGPLEPVRNTKKKIRRRKGKTFYLWEKEGDRAPGIRKMAGNRLEEGKRKNRPLFGGGKGGKLPSSRSEDLDSVRKNKRGEKANDREEKSLPI